MFFGQQGVVCLLKTNIFTKRGYASEYVEGVNNPEISRYIKRGYDRRGQLVGNVYEEPNQQKKPRHTSLRAIAEKRRGFPIEQRLSLQVDRQLEAAKQGQLVKQIDKWTQNTLQEFLHRGK